MLLQERRKLKVSPGLKVLENGIKHIVGRVNHPQTNGKIERFYGTLEAKTCFESIDEFIEWYNNKST